VFRCSLTGPKCKLDWIFTEFEVFLGLRFGFSVGQNTFFQRLDLWCWILPFWLNICTHGNNSIVCSAAAGDWWKLPRSKTGFDSSQPQSTDGHQAVLYIWDELTTPKLGGFFILSNHWCDF
jgi:hypothetical protein